MSRRDQVVYMAAAWCLSYPDEDLIAKVPLMRAALAEFPGAVQDFAAVLDLLESSGPMEIQAFCRHKLAPYKIPTRIEFRSELPKTMVGKVLRRVLVAEAKAKAQTEH